MGDAISWNGWPDCGEIDIMETVNSDNKCFGTVHWSDQHGRYAKYENSVDIDISLFHNYAVEWTSSSIRWFVDDHQYHNIGMFPLFIIQLLLRYSSREKWNIRISNELFYSFKSCCWWLTPWQHRRCWCFTCLFHG